MAEPKKAHIVELFADRNYYSIPRYQRGYDWKSATNVSELFDDLLDCLDSNAGTELFLGSVIFHKSAKGSKTQIIDGQQRITTLLIVLIACRNFARHELKNEKLALSIQKKIKSPNDYGEDAQVRLTASETIRLVFNAMCRDSWTGDFPLKLNGKGVVYFNRRLKPVYDFSYQAISDYCADTLEPQTGDEKLKQFLNQVYEKTYVIKIDVDKETEAFEIFERTNARGKGLEISDLLKNYLYSKNDELDKDSEEVWAVITENAGTNIIQMLMYFWVARKGRTSKRDLYRNIKNYANQQGIKEFVKELEEFSSFYGRWVSTKNDRLRAWLTDFGFQKDENYKKEFIRVRNALVLFRIRQVIPIVYSLLSWYELTKKTKKETKLILSLMRQLEFYHFTNNIVCDRIGNEVEKAYAEFSKDVFENRENSKKVSSRIKEFQNWLGNNIANEHEYRANFNDLTYKKNDRVRNNQIKYVFDLIENKKCIGKNRVHLLDYSAFYNGENPDDTIEHILSQSSDEEYVHLIGNLHILPKQINGCLNDKPYKEKMAILKNPNNFPKLKISNVPDYIKRFVGEYGEKHEWNEKEIDLRTINLANESYEILVRSYRY